MDLLVLSVGAVVLTVGVMLALYGLDMLIDNVLDHIQDARTMRRRKERQR